MTTYFIDPLNGSDDHTGTDENTPWRLPSAEQLRSLQAGDVLAFHRGRMHDGLIELHTAGINLRSYGLSEMPAILQNTTHPDDEGRLHSVLLHGGAQDVVIEGLAFWNNAYAGVEFLQSRTAYAALVKDCTFVGNGMGVNVKGSGVTINGCTFQDGRIVRNTPHPRKDDWGALGINLQQIMGYPLRDTHITHSRFTGLMADSYDYQPGDGGCIEFFPARNGEITDTT